MTLIDRLLDDTGTRVALTNGVDLGSDTYDDRGGTVEGDDGTDRFLPGLGEEIIDGGAGWDTLDFRGSDGLRVSLLNNSGTGRAAGDRYNGIEVVRGRGAV